MCNNPSYERPVISFQFAFVSVLSPERALTGLLCRLKVFVYLMQVCFPKPFPTPLVSPAHGVGALGWRMALILLFQALFGSLDLVTDWRTRYFCWEGPCGSIHSEWRAAGGDRPRINLFKLLALRFSCSSQEVHWLWTLIYLKGNSESYFESEIRSSFYNSSFLPASSKDHAHIRAHVYVWTSVYVCVCACGYMCPYMCVQVEAKGCCSSVSSLITSPPHFLTRGLSPNPALTNTALLLV